MTSRRENALNRAADRMVCRHLHLTAGKWTRKEEEPKYAPDRTCDVTHMKLEVSVRMEEHSAEMVCTQKLHAAYGPFDTIRLNAVDLEIRHVRDGRGRDLGYTYLDQVLDVRFPRPVRDEVDLVISYRVVQPSDGLYFQEPEGDGHDSSRQLWSQGEMEGARHWIPCHDAPNERTTLEMHVTAPESCTVICNGRLTGVRKAGRRRRWSFHQAQALPSYLISMVVGEYVRIEDEWNGVPVEYFVAPGLEEEARRSFGRTPEMMEFFSGLLGCPYPFDKYAQVTVRNFHYGGMENTSTTTQTAGTLHDERAAIDFTSDDLVSHELAHQWFGDLITCRSWTHAWLNEGFATYLEALWKEWDKGREEFDYEMVLNADSYMDEPYRRAISTPKYAHPFELFDMHLYPKAAWVLHMLRCHLGDELFWKSVRLYLQRHAGGTAETIDLIRACQDASGRNLERFFDQWIFSPGHPELEGEITWDEKASWIKVSLKQAQKREGGTPVFHIPVRVEACQGGDGSAPRLHGKTFEMDQAVQTFYLPLKAKPEYVVVDPEGAVLRTAKIKRPLEWVEAALTGGSRDERVPARVDLVRQLAEEAGFRSVRLLGKVLLEDPFWGVQAEAAASLGRLGSPAARDALIKAMGSAHPRTRRAVVTALGNFRDATVREALTEFVQGVDESYFVQSAALRSLGRSGGLEAAEELRAQLDEALERRDWHDTVALGAIQGLAAARDESAAPKLLEVASDLSRYWSVRLAAMKGLAELGASRPILAPAISEDLVRFLDDPRILISRRVPDALVTLGEQSAVAALRVRGEAAPVAESREAFLGAAEELAAKAGKSEDVDRLRTEMEKLREETRAMKQSLEAIQKKVMPDRKRKASR